MDEPLHRFLLPLGVAVVVAQVLSGCPTEEEEVRNDQGIVLAVGETIFVDLFLAAPRTGFGGVEEVEALEEATVEKGRDRLHRCHELFRLLEQGLVAHHGRVVAVVAPLAAEAPLVLGLVERGEEEVLQDGLVVARVAGFRLEAFEVVAGDRLGIEEFVRHQIALFDEPDEKQASEEADEVLGVVLADLLFVGKQVFLVQSDIIRREVDVLHRPEIPVGQFLVKILVDRLDREGLLDRL